jgi:hypothetical protein
MLQITVIVLILIGVVASPFLIIRAVHSLHVPERRNEGLTILGCGAIVVSSIEIIGWLTASPNDLGLFRFQALLMLAGYFGLGAVAGLWLWRVSRTWRKDA